VLQENELNNEADLLPVAMIWEGRSISRISHTVLHDFSDCLAKTQRQFVM
jgi:hypothetical protein